VSRARYIYGRHPVSEALRAERGDITKILVAEGARGRLGDLLDEAQQAGIPIEDTSKRALDNLVGGVAHQGIAAAISPFAYSSIAAILAAAAPAPPLVLALDQVQDPHNLGSLTRSAFALGAHGLVFPKDRSCEVTPTVVKASAGATAHLPMAQVTNLGRCLSQLKEAGLWVVGTAADADKALPELDLTGPIVIVIGSEGSGMRKMIAQACDFRARIPMAGTLGSLNAAVAGAICLYEAACQRAARPG
jgi:23S rRNA (guanosine2251-2'-O)-methyltransferase